MSRFKFEWKQKPAFGERNNTLKRFKTYQSFKSIMKYNQIPIFHSALLIDQQLHLISIATGRTCFVCWSDMNSISPISMRKLWTFSWYRASVFLRDISFLSLRLKKSLKKCVGILILIVIHVVHDSFSRLLINITLVYKISMHLQVNNIKIDSKSALRLLGLNINASFLLFILWPSFSGPRG